MITYVILLIWYSLVSLVVGLLPTGHLPQVMTDAFAYFLNLANLFSYVIPVDTLLQAAVLVLTFDGAIMLWHFINWIIRKIPGMQ